MKYLTGKFKYKIINPKRLNMEYNLSNEVEAIRSVSRTISKNIVIELEEWDSNGIQGCGNNCGTNIYVNGKKIEDEDGTRVYQALRAVLNHLGYKVEINYR
jgi:hypothetical protein